MTLPPYVETDGVAIVMRTHNRPHLLSRAIASVVGQTCGSWALVLVNNGDRACVEEACRPFSEALEGRVCLIDVPQSKGRAMLGALTNAGIRASKSRWLVVLDDDDTWKPRFLERTIQRLSAGQRHPHVRGVATQSVLVYDSDGKDGQALPSKPFNPTFKRVELLALAASNLFTGNAFVYERAALEEVGMYSETLPVLDDWEFNLRFTCRHDIDVIPQQLACYHRRDAGPSPAATSDHSPGDLHEFYHTKIINDHLRLDLRDGRAGMGWLMAMSNRMMTQGRKIGRIDQRTREMKTASKHRS